MGRRSVIGESLSWNVHASLFEEVGSETLLGYPVNRVKGTADGNLSGHRGTKNRNPETPARHYTMMAVRDK